MDQIHSPSSSSLTAPDNSIEERIQALERFTRYLRSQRLKQTQQRLRILEVFLKAEKHLSAEELYQRVRREDPEIGFSTVYRTLHLIVSSGIAREREFQRGRKLYDRVIGEYGHHHHLICTRCGKIVEFQCPEMIEKWQEEIARHHGFILESHTHELYGVCATCQKGGSSPKGR